MNRRRSPGKPSCAGRGSEAIAAALEAALCGTGGSVVRIRCFGRCDEGPIVRIGAGGRFFSAVSVDDLPAILQALNAPPHAQE